MNLLQNIYRKKEVLLKNMITQEARKKQDIVKQAIKTEKVIQAGNTEKVCQH